MTVPVSNNRTSILVPSQLPEFVREDHNTFVQFIQSYYKFLEDNNYKKAIKSNLSVSTEIGRPGAYQNTNIVYLSANASESETPISNGAKVNINGTITFASNVDSNSSIFTVNPPVPTRIVQGDFYVYEDRSSSTNSQLMDVTKNWSRYLDIDTATTDNQQVRQKLYDNYIKMLPKNLIADKTLIAKHAKEFYRSKGSEKSVQFLLRSLYGTESSFYYPKDDILRASDGKWYLEKSIRIGDITVDGIANNNAETNFVSKQITGSSSGAKAIVEDVNTYYKNGALVTELIISNSNKPFESNEEVYAYFQDTPTSAPKIISASIFGGQIVNVDILEGGTGYLEGTIVPVIPTSPTGSNAKIIISKVSRGGVNRIFVGANTNIGLAEFGGVGYRVDDIIAVIGGGGIGAFGAIESVWDNNFYHPNSYNIVATTIGQVSNYHIGDLWNVTPNLNINNGSDIANTVIGDAVRYWKYGPTGPAKFCYVIEEGQDYTGLPEFAVRANTRISNLSVLGKLHINDGGLNYSIGDTIEFINIPHYSYGTGAYANVTNVDANGSITEVHFQKMPGHLIGGAGYNQNYLPICNVVSSTGNGANIVVTNLLGTGGSFSFATETVGIIKALKIIEGGFAYTSPPYLNFSGLGDGTAQAAATTVTGIYSYPGRYINDDGFLSSKNKLQDRDYYQNFSYVIKSQAPISRYRPLLKGLTHPAGTKMYGRYEVVDVEPSKMNVSQSVAESNTSTVPIGGLRLHLDTANTIDQLTGYGYEFTVFDRGTIHVFEDPTDKTIGAITLDFTSFSHPITLVSLTDFGYIGRIYNGASVNQDNGILYFDGTNDFAYMPRNLNLDLTNLTVEAWFSPENPYQNAFIVEKGFNNTQYGILMQYNNITKDGELIWRVNLDGVIQDSIKASTTNVMRTGWNHVAVTHTAGAQTMYINGQFAGSNNLKGLIGAAPSGVTIGASGLTGDNPHRTYYYEGSVGIIRIYDNPLSETQIIKNFNRERIRYGL